MIIEKRNARRRAFHGIMRLHRFFQTGREDAQQERDLREAVSDLWEALSDRERERVIELTEEVRCPR